MLGEAAVDKLRSAHVAVFGVGGVGGFCVEALARAGIGKITLIDADRVAVSNINRQIIATNATVGQYKTEAMKARIADVNPECEVITYEEFYSEENPIPLDGIDYVADCIDSVRSKLYLITEAKVKDIAIISSMGAGNKLDPTRFEVSDIYKTSVCPLARVMRAELKKRGVKRLKVVYSKEEPIRRTVDGNGRHAPGSIAFVPSVVGLIIAGEVIKDVAFSATADNT